jgi:hypothetical protein
MFGHLKPIMNRSLRVGSVKEIEEWLNEIEPKPEGMPITKLIELKNVMPKT